MNAKVGTSFYRAHHRSSLCRKTFSLLDRKGWLWIPCWFTTICCGVRQQYFTATAFTTQSPLSQQTELFRTSFDYNNFQHTALLVPNMVVSRRSSRLSAAKGDTSPDANEVKKKKTIKKSPLKRKPKQAKTAKRAEEDEPSAEPTISPSPQKRKVVTKRQPRGTKRTSKEIVSDGSASESGESPKSKKTSVTKAKKIGKATKGVKKAKSSSKDGGASESDGESPKFKTASVTKAKKEGKATKGVKKAKTSSKDGSKAAKSSPAKKKPAKKADHQRLTERDPIPKLWNPESNPDSYTFTIISWNVAGLRAILRNHPTALSDLATKYDADVICLQETKLQEIHVNDPKLKIKGHLLEEEGYDSHFSCSTTKKGYSGTAVFVKRQEQNNPKKSKKKQATMDSFFGSKKNDEEDTSVEKGKKTDTVIDITNLIPEKVSMELGKEEHDSEGRIISVDFPLFSLSNLYVPNSGQKLDRLDYRTNQWDKDLLNFMQKTEKERGVPVMWLGDLNVAHTEMEVWNEGAKHLAKSAGTTPEERESFQQQLDAGYVDAFRKLHPSAKGQYTYWSQRAGNREPNKGLRLDYFICSPSLFDDSNKVVLRDCYIVPDQVGSDHCPIVAEMEIKK